MKKIVLDISCDILGILMMFIPLYCLGMAPLFLISTNIYFDTKHKNKFVLWRMALVILLLYVGHLIDIFMYELQTQQPIDSISELIANWAFGISAILTAVVFIIYQIFVIVASHKK